MILYPYTSRFVDQSAKTSEMKRGLHDFGLELEAVEIPQGGELVGVTVAEAERRCQGGCFVIQIDRLNGPSLVHPAGNVKIEVGDTAVLVLKSASVSAGAIFSARKKQASRRTSLYGARS